MSVRPGRLARAALSAFLVGAVSIGFAWAGTVLTPAPDQDPAETLRTLAGSTSETARVPAKDQPPSQAPLPSGSGFFAGAAKISMEPRPQDYNATWETQGCATFGGDAPGAATHVADFRVRWPENPNCIYMGGYGIGPMNPITNWEDPYGLWVRSVAMSDGNDIFVMTLIDAIYWEAKYDSLCEGIEGGCGWFDLQQWASKKFGRPESSFMFASTHSHTAPDFIGGWGGVPRWYMRQITDTIKASVTQAVESMKPAALEVGESIVRERNGERRDFYHSAEDDTLSWFRLLDLSGLPGGCAQSNAAQHNPNCRPAVIATLGAYPAHPVTEDTESGTADADFPGVFAKAVEDRFGGVGAFFQTGLGNMSPRGADDGDGIEEPEKVEMGEGLAAYVPDTGTGRIVDAPDVRSVLRKWDQPVTNVPLGALGATGFFDRSFARQPAQISVGKNSERACRSASPISVNTSITAAKVGPLWVTGGPGELFSNITNTIEERNPGGVTFALGLVNDGLGYLMQNFETDHLGRQGTGFVGDPVAEYEDAYSIDACFGDAALVYTLAALDSL